MKPDKIAKTAVAGPKSHPASVNGCFYDSDIAYWKEEGALKIDKEAMKCA
jgi:hypothetical protein